MGTGKSKLGFVLAITAFTFGSLALLLDASCSRARPVQQSQVAEERAADYPVPKYEKMALPQRHKGTKKAERKAEPTDNAVSIDPEQ